MHLPDSSVHLVPSSVHLQKDSVHLDDSSVHLKTASVLLEGVFPKTPIFDPHPGKNDLPNGIPVGFSGSGWAKIGGENIVSQPRDEL